MTTVEYNLVYVKSAENRLLLGMKQRGFGKNKWMGYGGKMEIGETIYESAQRELYEESNLFVELSDLNYLGKISNHRQNVNHLVHIFTAFKVTGKLLATDEMVPKWFDFNDLPFNEMVDDCKYWFHLMLADRKFDAEFWYDDQNNLIRKFVNYNQENRLQSITMLISEDEMNEYRGFGVNDNPKSR